jgi:Tfp pilus assembly protein PilE
METPLPNGANLLQSEGLRRVGDTQYEEARPRYEGKGPGGPLAVIVAVVLIFGVLMLGAIPLVQSGHEEPKSSEARAALGAIRDRARQIYQRNITIKAFSMKDLELSASELNGSAFKYEDYTCGGTPEKFWVRCRGVYESEPRDLELTGSLVTGSAKFNM